MRDRIARKLFQEYQSRLIALEGELDAVKEAIGYRGSMSVFDPGSAGLPRSLAIVKVQQRVKQLEILLGLSVTPERVIKTQPIAELAALKNLEQALCKLSATVLEVHAPYVASKVRGKRSKK